MLVCVVSCKGREVGREGGTGQDGIGEGGTGEIRTYVAGWTVRGGRGRGEGEGRLGVLCFARGGGQGRGGRREEEGRCGART